MTVLLFCCFAVLLFCCFAVLLESPAALWVQEQTTEQLLLTLQHAAA
jgi:hypothetical protein